MEMRRIGAGSVSVDMVEAMTNAMDVGKEPKKELLFETVEIEISGLPGE